MSLISRISAVAPQKSRRGAEEGAGEEGRRTEEGHRPGLNPTITFLSLKSIITLTPGVNVRVLVRQDWKSLTITNTIAYYENP
jgi:hypothetical protein